MRGTRNVFLLVVVGILVIFIFWGCSGYNKIVKEDENVKASWSNVQSSYQRRADLIPNLVNTVKGEANFEQETLTRVIEARAKATSTTLTADQLTPENIERFQQAQSQLSGALSRLLVTVEQYPNLKANEGFRALQAELAGTENRINVARNDFNTAVNSYNVRVRSFPMNIFAGMFGFRAREGFKADEGSQSAPKVDFSK